MSSISTRSAAESKTARSTPYYAILAVVAVGLWFLYLCLALSTKSAWWVPDWLLLPPASDDSSVLQLRGQVGDAFGVFNALVSTMALLGLVLTLRSQQRQLASQERHSEEGRLLVGRQQFQEQYFQAIQAYRTLLSEITVGPKSSQDSQRVGRSALQAMREAFVHQLRVESNRLFERAIEAQQEVFNRPLTASLQDSVKKSIGELKQWMSDDPSHTEEVLAKIGAAWSAIYQENRFQLDALFRAWYTAYRILETANSYQIPQSAIRLYSAMFRAQLSWIEMTLLLLNQSGLPPSPRYPRACHYSNMYAVFDNLDLEHDVVVMILWNVARRNEKTHDKDLAVLTYEAFGFPSASAKGD